MKEENCKIKTPVSSGSIKLRSNPSFDRSDRPVRSEFNNTFPTSEEFSTEACWLIYFLRFSPNSVGMHLHYIPTLPRGSASVVLIHSRSCGPTSTFRLTSLVDDGFFRFSSSSLIMNPTKDLIPLASDSNSISTKMKDIPEPQLKLEFKKILQKHEADHYKKWISTTDSISVTDTTFNTIHSDNYTSLYTLLSQEDVDALRNIAVTLNSTDDLHDCIKMYIEHRKGALNKKYRQVEQKLTIKIVCNMDEEQVFIGKIQWWIQVINIFLNDIFVKEKTFYENIFGGLETRHDNDDYVPIIGESALNLLTFVGSLDNIIGRREMFQRLEMLLPIYQALLDVIPEVDSLVLKDSDLARKIHSGATEIVVRIKQHMIQILSSFERQVVDESMAPTPGGKIHTMTECVVRFIDAISNYKDTLTNLIAGSLVFNDSLKDFANLDDQKSALSQYVARIIESLVHNLRNKSNVYANEMYGQLFMMNNVQYVVQSIKSSKKMQEIIDNDFQMRLSEKVEQAMSNYLRTTWNKVFECLDTKKSKSLSFSSILLLGRPTKSIKRKFKTFNNMFEEILLTHRECVVQDQKLKEKLHQSILRKLIPAYRHLLEEYGNHIAKVKHPDRYIKYSSVEDLKNKISNLF